MMKRLPFVATLLLVACGEKVPSDEQVRTSYEYRFCSTQLAERAGEEVAQNIIAKIRSEDSRNEGCADLDRVIRDQWSNSAFEPYIENACEWSSEPSKDPRELAFQEWEKVDQELASLCDWARKDAEARGRAVLNSLSDEDRREVENAWRGIE